MDIPRCTHMESPRMRLTVTSATVKVLTCPVVERAPSPPPPPPVPSIKVT